MRLISNGVKSKAIIGIDLGTETIKIAALESVQGEKAPRILGVGAAMSAGIKKGAVFDPNEVASQLKKALELLEKSSGVKTGNFYVSVSGVGLAFQKSKGLAAVSRADGEISKDDIMRAITACKNNVSRIQNREIIHQVPIGFKIDNEIVSPDPVGLVGSKLEAESIFISSFSQHLKNILKLLDTADIEAEDIFAGPLASSYAVLSKREKEVGVMLLDLGAATTSLILFEEGFPYSLEIIPFGSGHITQDVAIGFKTTLEEAEKLKVSYGAVVEQAENSSKKPARHTSGGDLVYGNYSRKKLADIIEARLSDIFELVEKHLKKVERERLLPGGVVLVGGGANLPGIVGFTKEYLNLPARVSEPENLEGYKEKVQNPAWSSAVGAALMAMEKSANTPRLLHGKSGIFISWLRAFLP